MLNNLLSIGENLIKWGTKEWKDGVLGSLDIMWKGCLAIFLVISLIILAVVALRAILTSAEKKKEAKANTAKEEGSSADGQG